jgi:hypothetical protein
MNVWRAKINSGRAENSEFWDAAKRYCREVGVVGVGWGRPNIGLDDGAGLEEVLAEIAKNPNWSSGVAAVRRLASQVADGDLVWTRDRAGTYWLGRIFGDWRFDVSEQATTWDLNNVRPCQWLERPMRDYEVPGGVVRSFVGAGSSFRRVGGDAACGMSELIYAAESGGASELSRMGPEQVITDLLDPTDVEDLVLLFLQWDGWLLMPSTRMRDTPLYEAAFRHRDNGRLAVVSVKSGSSAYVPVAELAAANPEAEIFVFSTEGLYGAPPGEQGVRTIERPELTEFMSAHPELLPPRISRWLGGSPA